MAVPPFPALTRHAEERMAQRGITEADVRVAWSNQNEDQPGDWGSVWVCGWAPGGRRLKMCVTLPNRDKMITAAWER